MRILSWKGDEWDPANALSDCWGGVSLELLLSLLEVKLFDEPSCSSVGCFLLCQSACLIYNAMLLLECFGQSRIIKIKYRD